MPELLPLICPSCKQHTKRGLELSSLELTAVFEKRAVGNSDEIVRGTLRCLGCARSYAIIDGIPVLLREPLTAAELFAISAQNLEPELLAALAAPAADETALPHQLESLGAYLDASWGDCAEPPPNGPVPAFGFIELAGRVSGRAQSRVSRALELGCGVGRGLSILRRGAELTVGIDRNPAALRFAARILRGEDVHFPRRQIGRTYSRATIRAGQHTASDVQLICADVLEPPLAPGGFERLAALNLLDAVRAPKALLHHLTQLAAPGGELLLSTPYSWRSGVTLEEERLGGSEPELAVAQELKSLGWSIEEEEPRLSWVLRRDARSASHYQLHWLRARKS